MLENSRLFMCTYHMTFEKKSCFYFPQGNSLSSLKLQFLSSKAFWKMSISNLSLESDINLQINFQWMYGNGDCLEVQVIVIRWGCQHVFLINFSRCIHFLEKKKRSFRNRVSLFKGTQSIAGNTGCMQAEKLAFCKLMQIALINIKAHTLPTLPA